MTKVENRRIAYKGKFEIAQYDVTDTEKNHSYVAECFERGDSVAALVFDSDKQTFLFTRQFRIGSQSELIELVAGSMDVEGENPMDTIKRELMEEMGCEVDFVDGVERCFPVGSFYVSPGGTSERIHLFIIDKIIRKSSGGGVENENIKIVEYTISEMQELLNANTFIDLKTLFLIQNFYLMSQQI